MITYGNSGGVFGLKMLFRIHGSAVFKSCTPAILSSIFYVILFQYTDASVDNPVLEHPYPMSALVTAFSFLLIFRANFSYNRYWEAHTAIHAMHSKWLDVATELTAFHLQSTCYNSIQPPSFGEHTKAVVASSPVKRQQNNPMTQEELETQIDSQIERDEKAQPSLRSRFKRGKSISRFLGRRKSQARQVDAAGNNTRKEERRKRKQPAPEPRPRTKNVHFASRAPNHRNASDFWVDTAGTTTTPHSSFWIQVQERLHEGHMGDAPTPLFLEAVAHLLSLMSAVSLSTLRNDLEEAESPLAEFRPNAPWPFVDPDSYKSSIRSRWNRSEYKIYTVLRYLLGLSRTNKSRRLYNKGRPFRVIGNVSDEEIKAIQAARGPQAKVTLISLWLQELITREYMAGSMGRVAPPIISRLYQFISDGMVGYNQARKIAYIPFPFPHSQLTTLFVLVIVGFVPLLMLTYVDDEAFGFIWNWLTVMCFTGLHEVARELENPFQNVPNEIPLNNFQAQFNEGLMVMFFGYHPDAYWLKEGNEKKDGDGDDHSDPDDKPAKVPASITSSLQNTSDKVPPSEVPISQMPSEASDRQNPSKASEPKDTGPPSMDHLGSAKLERKGHEETSLGDVPTTETSKPSHRKRMSMNRHEVPLHMFTLEPEMLIANGAIPPNAVNDATQASTVKHEEDHEDDNLSFQSARSNPLSPEEGRFFEESVSLPVSNGAHDDMTANVSNLDSESSAPGPYASF